METYESTEGNVIVRLDRGDDTLQSIRKACEEHDIDTGAVVSGIGTFKELRVHYLATDDLTQPEECRDEMIKRNGAWEVSAMQGLIADGEPHIHVTAFNGETTIGGHLEEGCIINALGEVLIHKDDDLELERKPDEFGVGMIQSR